jgi:hypothetical protein
MSRCLQISPAILQASLGSRVGSPGISLASLTFMHLRWRRAIDWRSLTARIRRFGVYATEEVALVPEPFDARLGFDLAAAS